MEIILVIIALIQISLSLLQVIFFIILFQYLSKRVDTFIDNTDEDLKLIERKIHAILENK